MTCNDLAKWVNDVLELEGEDIHYLSHSLNQPCQGPSATGFTSATSRWWKPRKGAITTATRGRM